MATPKAMLRFGALALGFFLMAGAASCNVQEKPASGNAQAPPANLSVAIWKDGNDATFRGETKEVEPGTALAGKAADGSDVYTFVRADIGAEFLENEVYDARLFLKTIGGRKPASLRLGLASAFWDSYFTPYDEAKSLAGGNGFVTVDARDEADGWISVPVTDFVKKWLGGAIQNNGVAIAGEAVGETYAFASVAGADANGDDAAYIEARGAVGDRNLTYGKFGYTEITAAMQDDTRPNSNGNCMSYALRDTNSILESDLGVDIKEMERIYTEAGAGKGLDSLADYFARLAEGYVQAHKDGLEISSFRHIDGFESEIDPAAEYRIALRVGVDLFGDEVDFSDPHSWDFHYWAQLNDGRWAQKFPPSSSVIVPCTGPGIPPDRFPWDSANHRVAKTADYYKSKAVYFAVAKKTGAFTRHRGETEDRPL